MQIVSSGDNLHEMSKPIFWEKGGKYFIMSSAEIFTQHALVYELPHYTDIMKHNFHFMKHDVRKNRFWKNRFKMVFKWWFIEQNKKKVGLTFSNLWAISPIDKFVMFSPSKQTLAFHADFLQTRQLAWN